MAGRGAVEHFVKLILGKDSSVKDLFLTEPLSERIAEMEKYFAHTWQPANARRIIDTGGGD